MPENETLRFIARRLYLLCLLALLSGISAFAQTARVTGTVTDPQGNAVVGASVQVVDIETGAKTETKSGSSGEYSVSSLPAGNYQVTVEAEGFGTTTGDAFSLANGQAYTFNAQLAVAAAKAENVTVTAGSSAAQIELESASNSTTMSEKEVTGLGLNGRNFSQLIATAPGVSNQTGQDEGKVGVAGSAKFSVNGGRVEYNTFEVDGSDVLNTSINASRGQGEPLMVYPSIDAIEDVKVLTSNYSALYGKSASGSVLITTKSGGDKFHGTAYEFLRNEIFNARNYFDQPDPEPLGYQGKLKYRTPLYRRQDFGGAIGGPLFIPHLYNTSKSKTFFFFSEELREEKTPVDYNQAVPTLAERSGDFSDVCPVQQPGVPYSLNPSKNPDCPRNIGTENSVATVNYGSRAILSTGLIPAPNSVNGCNTTNPTPFYRCYVGTVSPPTHWREELGRIDQVLTSTELLAFRYIHDSWDTVTLTPQWGIVQNSFPTVENMLDGPGENMVVTLTQSLPHKFTNNIGASYAVQHITLTPQPGPGVSSLQRPAILDNASAPVTADEPYVVSSAAVAGAPLCSVVSGPTSNQGKTQTLTECPMGYIFNNGFGGNKLPGLIFQGTNSAYGGHGFAVDTGYAPWNQANPTYSLRDDASKTIGRHNLQFGVQATYVQQNEVSAISGANSGDLQGLLTFSNQQSRYTSGNAFADFLAGYGPMPIDSETGKIEGSLATGTAPVTAIKSYTQDSAQRKYYNRYKIAEFYLQDDWKTPLRGLTLNAGFRASLFGAWYNPQDTAYNWSPEAYNPSVGSFIQVDPNYGYLVNSTTGAPVPLDRGDLDPAIRNGLVQCGKDGVPDSCMTNKLFHPAPRLGLSWDPFGNGKTAIHAGYGLFWEHGTGYEANVGSLIGSAPLVLSETQSNIPRAPLGNSVNGTVDAYNTIGFACQQGVAQCGTLLGGPSAGLPTFTPATMTTSPTTYPLNVASIPNKAVYSNAQQWSLSIQRELSKTLIAQVGYVGTKGTHLTAVRDLNQRAPLSPSLNPFLPGQPITASVCSSGANNGYFPTSSVNTINLPTSSAVIGPDSPGYVNMVIACTGNAGFVSGSGPLGISADDVRPFPGFSNIISVENVADSEYSALQSTLRQTVGSLTLGVAYTWSHSLDDASDRASANFADSLDIHSSHASSDFDQRHLLNVNYIYDLPFVKLLEGFSHLVGSGSDAASGSYWTAGPAAETWLGGWQFSGITVFETGTPFSVLNGGGPDGTGALDNAGVGDGLGVGSYPDVIGSVHNGKPYVPQNVNNVGPLLLNPGAFTAPRGLSFGDSGRNYLRNPTRTNFNMDLLKHFKPFGEGPDLEFRAEAFNVFNHTQFRIYDPAHPGNTGNNVINCYGDIATGYSAGASGCLNGNSFLHPVDAHDPRILQFALKAAF